MKWLLPNTASVKARRSEKWFWHFSSARYFITLVLAKTVHFSHKSSQCFIYPVAMFRTKQILTENKAASILIQLEMLAAFDFRWFTKSFEEERAITCTISREKKKTTTLIQWRKEICNLKTNIYSITPVEILIIYYVYSIFKITVHSLTCLTGSELMLLPSIHSTAPRLMLLKYRSDCVPFLLNNK